MTALWTHKTAQAATGGQAVGEWEVSGLSIDTRTLEPGQLFVPLKDIRDGHGFIPAAYAKGAGAVISEHPITDNPALIVPDNLQALEDLAIAARQRSNAVRIAVTGSVGKTSVKELISVICQTSDPTHASIKSYNNHWGVPLTLASMPENTKYGIFEMGMNHAGELQALTKIVRPNIAVITKIAAAHLAHFKSVKAIAFAKAEILSGLTKDGIAILPRDSEYYELLAGQANRVLSFGWHEKANARIVETTLSPTGSRSVICIAGRNIEVELPLPGRHWVENTACALLVAYSAGIELNGVIKALKIIDKLPGRGEIFTLRFDNNTVTLIDESYNANPQSMNAAIATLGLNEGRKIAVLGDMLELGPAEAQLHADLLEPLQDAKIDLVMTCGERMKNLESVLPGPMNGGWYTDDISCFDGLKALLKHGDILMVKGSNASGMGKLVAALKQQTHADNNNNKKDNAHVL